MKNTNELGKIVGMFLFKGHLREDGIVMHLGGYGKKFTRELLEILADFGNKNKIEVKRKDMPDSSIKMVLYSKELRDEIEDLLYNTDNWKCPMTSNMVVKKSKKDTNFKDGVLYMMERDQESEFQTGTKLSYEEEKKIWNLM